MPRDDLPPDPRPRTDSLDETLRVARDLCAAIGAFFVTSAGQVRMTSMDAIPGDDATARAEALAKNCLIHPAVRDRSLFSNAEMTTGVDAAERALACVALPVWSNGTISGLRGVIDTWLPELDDEQRAGLVSLGGSLARQLVAGENLVPATPQVPTSDAEPAAAEESDVDEPRAESEVAPEPPSTPGTELARTTAERDYTPAETEQTDVFDEEVEAVGGDRLESFLGEVLDHLPQGLLVTRTDGAVVLVNQTFSAMTGLPIDGLLGEDASEIISDADFERTDAGPGWLAEVLGRARPDRSLLLNTSSGEPLVTEASGAKLASRYAGDCLVTLIREVPASGRGQQVRDAPLDELLDAVDEGIICLDSDGVVIVANQAARVLNGLSAERPLVGLPFTGATALCTTAGEPLPAINHPLLEVVRDGTPRVAHLILPGQTEETTVHVAMSARPVRVGNRRGSIAVMRDITAEWNEQEQLAHFALHDPLTGLANRYLLLEELQRMLRGLGRRGGNVSLIFLDLDDFKRINDENGHAVGDEILKAVGRRLQGAVRGDDVVTRLGGDEFIVAHVSSTEVTDGDRIVARIRKVLSAPYLVGSGVLDVKVSLGWVSTGSVEMTPQELLDQADKVMYSDKRKRASDSNDR